MIVVDASALLEVLLQTDAAAAIEARLFSGETLHAPHLLDLEVAQVLRRYQRVGELSAQRGREALEDLGAFRIERYPHHIPTIFFSIACGRYALTPRPTMRVTSLSPKRWTLR